jgi:CBS-domain-containing membrane protein
MDGMVALPTHRERHHCLSKKGAQVMAHDNPRLSYVRKLRGQRVGSGLPYPNWREALVAGGGGALAIAVLYLLTTNLGWINCFLAPLGATCALVFGVPSAPVAQPRNVVGGNVLAALVGLAVYALFGQASWWTLGLAIGLSMALMVLTKTYHPPAAVTAILPLLGKITAWSWALLPVAVGAALVVVVAVLYNNLYRDRHYPVYWW